VSIGSDDLLLKEIEKILKEETKPTITSADMAVLQYFIEDERIPQQLRETFFALVSKTLVLSNLKDDDIYYLENMFCAIVDLMAASIPDWQWTWLDAIHFMSLKAWIRAQLKRGYEGFERRMSATSIQMKRIEYSEQEQRRGFLARLFRR